MKRVIASTVASMIVAVFVGVGLQYCLMDTPFHHHDTMPLLRPILLAAHFYALLVNLVFFYIRRWDGCIEKLGGATFTFFIYLATIAPLYFFKMHFDEPLQALTQQFSFVVLVQLAFIGFLSTHFLRTKNFNPPKPGEPFRW